MLEPPPPAGHAPDPLPPADTPLPAPTPVVVVGTPEWDELNERRHKLIVKKNRQGLTAEERVEFDRLQEIAGAALAVAFPVSPLVAEVAALERLMEARYGRPAQ